MKIRELLYNKVWLCLWAILALAACNDDTMGTADTTTLNLVFSTRVGDVNDENALADEGIKTLRVILVQNGKVVVNYKSGNLSQGDAPVLSQTITFWQIPKAQSTFYTIANEESIDGLGDFLDGFMPNSDFGTNEDNAIRTRVITVQTGHIPGDADDIETSGLPIAGIHEEDLSNATDGEQITIPITRAVAKMELTLTNETGEDFSLNKVTLGNFFPNSTYLFPQAAELTLPGDATPYTGHTFEIDNVTLSDGAERTFYFYFYESNAGEEAYTIALNNDEDYAATPIMLDENTPLSSIARNTCLRVTGTINSKDVEVTPSFKVVVIDWGEVNNPEISFD